MTVDAWIAVIMGFVALGVFSFKINKLEKSEERFKHMVAGFPRPPAYTLDRKRTDHLFTFSLYMMGLFVIPIYAMLTIAGSSRWLAVVFAVIGCSFCLIKALKMFGQLTRVGKGIQAEMLVGMSLESGLDSRFTILHDFQLGDDYNHGSNIDHLVISPKGIYIIETKYKSCSSDDEPMLRYDREFITDPSGYKSDVHIKQIKGLIDQFKGYCKREFGISELPVKIQGFIVYAGWGVDFGGAKYKSIDEYNIRVNAPEPMLKAMMTVADKQRRWDDARTQDELVRHLQKRNMIKVNKKK